MKSVRTFLRLCLCLTMQIVSIRGITTGADGDSDSWRGFEIVKIDECVPSKYFWQEKRPDVFYACLSMSKHAVRMRCRYGTYMCNTDPKLFRPCSCRHNETHVAHHVNYGGRNPYGKEGATDQPNAIPNIPRPATRRPNRDNNGDVNFRHVRPDDTWESLPSIGCPDKFQKYAGKHMFRGYSQAFAELKACQNACLATDHCLGVDWDKLVQTPDDRRCFFIFPESTIYGLEPQSDYCCDHYRRTNCATGAGDVTAPVAPTSGNGAGIGRNKKVAMGDETVLKPTVIPLANRRNNDGSVAKEGGVIDIENSSTFRGNSGEREAAGTDKTGAIDRRNNGDGLRRQVEDDFDSLDLNIFTVTSSPPRPTFPPGGPFAHPKRDTPPTAADARSSDNRMRTTIPHSGCPYAFREYPGMSHPFGVNVTKDGMNDEVEECKYWCLIHGFCAGVDFDSLHRTCFLLREIQTGAILNVEGVTHYRKTDCPPPLRCWEETIELESLDGVSVVDPRVKQVECYGVCYVRQNIKGSGVTLERGCLMSTNAKIKPVNGCGLDKDTMSVTCLCDTARCNGLSVDALTSQLLYLPLDGDLVDHSGLGHHGSILSSLNGKEETVYKKPSFTCLDKAVNCSAIFSGHECITVETLANAQWGNHDNTSSFAPQVSFAVWFKRVSMDGNPRQEGIFGNSKDFDPASWRIIGEKLKNRVGAGVVTQTNSLSDYQYIYAEDGEWHLAVLTYNGINSAVSGQFPVLQFYLDGEAVLGNARADNGPIQVQDQPVTLGCVSKEFFMGFIDEARIFSSVLSVNDIKALMAMRDTKNWW